MSANDSLLLKLAVSKNLLAVDLAKEVYQVCQREGRPALEVLLERGVITPHIADQLAKEVERAQGPKTIGGFRIVGKLGQGGMGAVYRAVQVSMDREVALKVIAPEFAKDKDACERFLREGRAAGKINHPNVITCYDVGQDGRILYMAMELVLGGDVDQAAKAAGGRLPLRRALDIIRDAARGLAAIHEAGLIHRDIKPANIFLTSSGTAKLADLGLARTTGGDDRMTMTGATVGTPAFMAPEQADGAPDVDIRGDIYALGATLYALLSGQPPFRGSSPWAVVAAVLKDPFPDPRAVVPGLDPGVAHLILRCCAKDPRERFQTPADLGAALDALLSGDGATFHPPVLPAFKAGAAGPASHAPTVRADPTAMPGTTTLARLRKPAWILGLGASTLVVVVASVVILGGRKDAQANHAAALPVATTPPRPGPLPSAGSTGVDSPPASLTAASSERRDAAGDRASPLRVASGPQATPTTEAPIPPTVARTGKGTPGGEAPGEPGRAIAVNAPSAPPTVAKPSWAAEAGADAYGDWAKLVIEDQTQVLRLIPAGKFLMGSGNGEPDEKPVHPVEITTPFWLGESEVTQGMWQAVMGSNPSYFVGDPRRPVEMVSWTDCQGFIGKLNARVPGLRAGLPSEAQWEYACRAGLPGEPTGDLASVAWYEENSEVTTYPVKSKQPNAWGLYDMRGNVWEWCLDHYDSYGAGSARDPVVKSGYYFVHRGGSWHHSAKHCRVSARFPNAPDHKNSSLGFRLAIPGTDGNQDKPPQESLANRREASLPTPSPGSVAVPQPQARSGKAFVLPRELTNGLVAKSNFDVVHQAIAVMDGPRERTLPIRSPEVVIPGVVNGAVQGLGGAIPRTSLPKGPAVFTVAFWYVLGSNPNKCDWRIMTLGNVFLRETNRGNIQAMLDPEDGPVITDDDSSKRYYRAGWPLTHGPVIDGPTNILKARAWSHVAVTFSPEEIVLYHNGLRAAQYGKTDVKGALNPGFVVKDSDLSIGLFALDEFYLWNRALQEDEVKSLYGAYPEAPEAPRDLTISGRSAFKKGSSIMIPFNGINRVGINAQFFCRFGNLIWSDGKGGFYEFTVQIPKGTYYLYGLMTSQESRPCKILVNQQEIGTGFSETTGGYLVNTLKSVRVGPFAADGTTVVRVSAVELSPHFHGFVVSPDPKLTVTKDDFVAP